MREEGMRKMSSNGDVSMYKSADIHVHVQEC